MSENIPSPLPASGAPALLSSPTPPPLRGGNTPIKSRSGSNRGILSDLISRSGKETQVSMGKDLVNEIVGGISPDEFLKEFVPKPSGKNLPASFANFADLVVTGRGRAPEKDMYPSFIGLVEASNILGEGFYILNTSDAADKQARPDRRWKPDMSTFKGKKPNPPPKAADFTTLDLPIEAKPAGVSHAFKDTTLTDPAQRLAHKFLPNTEDGIYYRGQVISVLAEIFARQHRTHAFLLHLGDPTARFIRADRAGMVVSEAFDYRQKPSVLAEFLWRYHQMSDEDRGFDPTVRPATDEEEGQAHILLKEWEPKQKRPVVVIKVPVEGQLDREVIAWGSIYDPEDLTGRSTRAYPVIDKSTGRLAFLKDLWRAEGLETESGILAHLKSRGVPNIPNVLCGGDLVGEYQNTASQGYIGRTWQCGEVAKLSKRVHHRLLEDFIPHTLQHCDNARQLMQVIYHAFLAHKAAYDADYLHRDISHNNVMVTGTKPNLVGILSDWDLAFRWRDEEGNHTSPDTRHRFRTGTWYYMSVALLKDPVKPHSLQDDLESFFWLVLYASFRWFDPRDLRMNAKAVEPLTVHSVLNIFKEATEEAPGSVSGGDGKLNLISHNVRLGPIWSFHQNQPLTDWVKSLQYELKEYFDFDFKYSISDLVKPEVVKIWNGLGMKDHSSMETHFKAALAKTGWSPHKVEVVLDKKKTSDRSKRPLPLALASSSASEAPVIKKQRSTTPGPSHSNSLSGA